MPLTDYHWHVAECPPAVSNFAPRAICLCLQSYEVREYPAHRWVCTHELTAGFFSSVDDKEVFRRLFRYFSGKNGAGERYRKVF